MDMNYKQTFKQVLSDRVYLSVIVGMVVAAIVTTVYILLTVEARDIQITTQYSSYGQTNYFKGQWYQLYGFIALAILIAAGHTALMLKFVALQYRNLGILFGITSIVVILVGLVYAANVIQQLAFL